MLQDFHGAGPFMSAPTAEAKEAKAAGANAKRGRASKVFKASLGAALALKTPGSGIPRESGDDHSQATADPKPGPLARKLATKKHREWKAAPPNHQGHLALSATGRRLSARLGGKSISPGYLAFRFWLLVLPAALIPGLFKTEMPLGLNYLPEYSVPPL